jgi:hypothetical protein
MADSTTPAGTARQLHALEEEFGLPAAEILDTINRRNRCKIAVRGAIAEAHLIRRLGELQRRGAIGGFEDFDRDGYPDVRVDLSGRSFLVECKNVQKEGLQDTGGRAPPRRRGRTPAPPSITVDFQRTRAPIGHPELRYYAPDEFQVLAACLWNRTQQWDFLIVATRDLPRHATYRDRLATRVVVGEPPGVWTDDLAALLRTL